MLIIEGVELFETRAVHPNAVQGALSWITLDLGLSVIMTKNTLETALFISMTAKKEEGLLKRIEDGQDRKAMKNHMMDKPKIIHHGNLEHLWRRADIKQTVKILTSIDKIGQKTATNLAAMGMTIAKISALSFDELNKIKHLSIAQSKSIYLALHCQPPMTNALVFN